jgi:hypothetical protein
MSAQIQQYWKDRRMLEATLPEFVWLVATAAGAPPFVTQAAAGLAAKLLHAKSHRVASDEEVEAHHVHDATALKQARQERMRKSGAAVVVVKDVPVEEPPATSAPVPRRRR